jgi:hypothetical protein
MPSPSSSAPELNAQDYANLALVAQGQSAQLNDDCKERLLAAGLVMRIAASEAGDASLQLSAAGLALIRSSDQ